MEMDKKALAVSRLVTLLYEWDPNTGNQYRNKSTRERAVNELISKVLPDDASKQHLINMILAMTLLTSGHVESVRNPDGFEDLKAQSWTTILSEPSLFVLKALGYPYYNKVSKNDYVLAKKILPFLGSSSMLQDEVEKIFSSTSVPGQYPKLAATAAKEETGLGGYKQLYRGLSDMSDNSVVLVTDTGTEWDMERGVSTSRNYASAEGFSTKEGGNSILFILDNPKKKGFSALELSKFKKEEEIVLSGRIRIDRFQLTCYAEEVGSSLMGKTWTFELTQDSIFIRRGIQPYMKNETASNEEVRKLITDLFSGKETEVASSYGAAKVVKLVSKSATVRVFGTIL